MTSRQYGRYTVELSSLDKVMFPDDGLTKEDLIDYYEAVAPLMLPHLKDRALTLNRYPDGIGEDGFYQQNAADYFPEWLETKTLPKEDGEVEHILCANTASLVYLANQGTITPHAWLARIDKPDTPDQMIFDLDPPEEGGPALVKEAALALRELLQEIGLPAYVKSTGSRGLHVMVPLRREEGFDDVRAFARKAADCLAARHPDKFTTEQRKNKRKGRLFLDTLRNAYGQTAVAPFALRAYRGAPVAMPLSWDELESEPFDARRYGLEDIRKRANKLDDPWAAARKHARSLTKPREKLQAMLDGA